MAKWLKGSVMSPVEAARARRWCARLLAQEFGEDDSQWTAEQRAVRRRYLREVNRAERRWLRHCTGVRGEL